MADSIMNLEAEQNTIRRLLAAGFVPFGVTDTNVVEIPPVERKLSIWNLHVVRADESKTVNLDGRKRYVLPGSDLRATVGPRTTFFYYVIDHEMVPVQAFDTYREADEIARKITALVRAASTAPSAR
jgi:hypothetical protein